ncbi:type II secretion system minor pseudopilin GspK [uncultured Thiothrix sp.]|uniref:type II secretion system minor pseudopilin GspK n=1 Tax=uncultured Thiothrix sp. TaxID=223185 RepID=UPI0026150E54|nr:type II secretion system minor pseudopilin GspK [uncultured Thiothrix sp.]
MKSQRRQQGVAMLTALLIVALAVIVVTSIFVQQRYSIRLSNNLQDLEQTYQYAYAAEKMAGVWLAADIKETKDGAYDSLKDNWAQKIDPKPIDDDNGQPIGELQVKIDDLQAYFNVNNLYDVKTKKPSPSMMKVFQQILVSIDLSPTNFANAIVDWVDPDDQLTNSNSAESDYYLLQEKPYKASNALILDTKELYLIKLDDVSDNEQRKTLLAELMPLITALPTTTSINVNTAPANVLTAIGLTDPQLQAIVQKRNDTPIKSVEALQQLVQGLTKEQKNLLGVSSNYFRLSGEVRLRKSRLFLNSVLFRSAEGKVHVIMRQFNRVSPPPEIEPEAS